MRILLYSRVFWPSIGGVETITATLADNLTRLGYECTVVTETPLNTGNDIYDYQVVRRPNLSTRIQLVRQCSLVHSNGASVALYPLARLLNKPFIWTHNGYQVSCVDGLGWDDNGPAPMRPFASLKYYLRKRGLFYTAKEAVKLGVRRSIAGQVDLNIACTQWVAERQPLSNQIVAYTPYALSRFRNVSTNPKPTYYDFIFVGRLVSEKGVSDLIQAFKQLVSESVHNHRKLAIVGDGYMKPDLLKLVEQLNLSSNVFLLGSKYGEELAEIVSNAQFGVVPSIWEEPMGGVSLELMAAGKHVIVSRRGGHAECVGTAGLTFENGDSSSLHQCMRTLLMADASSMVDPLVQVQKFDEVTLTQQYVDIYQSSLEKRHQN